MCVYVNICIYLCVHGCIEVHIHICVYVNVYFGEYNYKWWYVLKWKDTMREEICITLLGIQSHLYKYLGE
jgi:hypothetical protein